MTNTKRITVTDTIGTSGSVTVDKHDVAESIRPWYPEAPTEVHDAADELQTALMRDEDYSGWAEYLGVTVEDDDTEHGRG